MGTGYLCRMPPAAVSHGRARQSSGTEPCGDCRRVLEQPAGSVFGENSFCRETRGTRLGDRHVAKRSSDPRVAYPGQNSGTRPSASCGYCYPLCPTGVGIRGNFVLSCPRE